MYEIGTEVPIGQTEDHFKAPEGSANMYYGLIRSGKTYAATADIHEELRQGHTVYATWPIKVRDFDDRRSFIYILRGIIFPWKKRYYEIPCSQNLHYINAETGEVDGERMFDPTTRFGYIDYLNKLNHCSLYIDEAWRVIDSYQGTNLTIEGRNLILVTGHKFRTVNLIAQRPTSVHVVARGNINRFYKCEKIATLFGIPLFKRSEFQEMTMETVNETVEPISVKKYWGSKKIFDSYNSWYYGELNPLHDLKFRVYELNYPERILAFFLLFLPFWSAFSSVFKRKTGGNRI